MHVRSVTLLAAAVIAAAGCSSTPTQVDTGPIHARTFSFVNPGPKAAPSFADNRQPVHAMVQQAITRNLQAKGLTRVDQGGEITVGYLIIVGNNASTTAINDYFGYGSDAAALHDKAQSAYSASKNPNYFEAGTLVIDLIDTKTFKLLRRGYVTRPLLRDLPDDVRQVRLQEAVDAVLAGARFVS